MLPEEQWIINQNNNTKITLYWESLVPNSAIELAQITILGLKNAQWVPIKSVVDNSVIEVANSSGIYTQLPSTIAQGSISTAAELTPSLYDGFTIGYYSTPQATEIVTENLTTPGHSNKLENYTKIKSIHFPFREHNITPYSTDLIEKLAQKIAPSNPTILLIGHTDSFVNANFNYSLGEKRANSVKEMLKQFGVNTIYIDIVSKGKDEAKYDCETMDCDSRETVEDRRVDIYIKK